MRSILGVSMYSLPMNPTSFHPMSSIRMNMKLGVVPLDGNVLVDSAEKRQRSFMRLQQIFIACLHCGRVHPCLHVGYPDYSPVAGRLALNQRAQSPAEG